MPAYTKEQNELVKQIRDLQQKQAEYGLDYNSSVQLYRLIKEADAQGLCWW